MVMTSIIAARNAMAARTTILLTQTIVFLGQAGIDTWWRYGVTVTVPNKWLAFGTIE